MIAAVGSVAELRDVLGDADRVLPVAGGTKAGLSRAGADGVTTLDLGAMSGITAYDPAELTVTARAGTPIAEIEAELGRHGQCMPFDPLLTGAGATIGGTVAAGLSGPGACGHGTVRDFVIGVTILDGGGREIAAGGRVVKNAAGFDLPKLMVGSAGRLGVMTEVCCKVFPRPQATATLAFECGSTAAAVKLAARLARGPVTLDALELDPPARLLARVAGPTHLLDARARRLAAEADADSAPVDDEAGLWEGLVELDWAPADTGLVAAGVTLGDVARLEERLGTSAVDRHYSLGPGLALIAWPEGDLAGLAAILTDLGLAGIVVIGTSGETPLIGAGQAGNAFGRRVRTALDPGRRFLELWP
ncbi:MAG TPA: FAD-binding protein [Solirubrobacterales bacterium]|nr:FAD-binding protein [Solirubrobacterales bacterium]